MRICVARGVPQLPFEICQTGGPTFLHRKKHHGPPEFGFHRVVERVESGFEPSFAGSAVG